MENRYDASRENSVRELPRRFSLDVDMPDYSVRSNREEGNGRTDIVLYPDNPKDPAYIFVLKQRKSSPKWKKD